MTTFDEDRCGQSELTSAYAAQALPAGDVAAAEAHIAALPALPARVGGAASGGRPVRLVADRRAASADVAAGAPCATDCRGDRERTSAAAGAAMARAGLGAGRTRHRVQAAGDRRRTAPGQHAGAPGARRALSGAYPCRRRRAASARRRAMDRRAQAFARRLQLRPTRRRATSASGARPAAPAFWSPAPGTSCAEATAGAFPAHSDQSSGSRLSF